MNVQKVTLFEFNGDTFIVFGNYNIFYCVLPGGLRVTKSIDKKYWKRSNEFMLDNNVNITLKFFQNYRKYEDIENYLFILSIK